MHTRAHTHTHTHTHTPALPQAAETSSRDLIVLGACVHRHLKILVPALRKGKGHGESRGGGGGGGAGTRGNGVGLTLSYFPAPDKSLSEMNEGSKLSL